MEFNVSSIYYRIGLFCSNSGEMMIKSCFVAVAPLLGPEKQERRKEGKKYERTAKENSSQYGTCFSVLCPLLC